jgi:hypothetical protein
LCEPTMKKISLETRRGSEISGQPLGRQAPQSILAFADTTGTLLEMAFNRMKGGVSAYPSRERVPITRARTHHASAYPSRERVTIMFARGHYARWISRKGGITLRPAGVCLPVASVHPVLQIFSEGKT